MSTIYMMMGAVIVGLSVWVMVLQDQLATLHRKYPETQHRHVYENGGKRDFLAGGSKTWVVDEQRPSVHRQARHERA